MKLQCTVVPAGSSPVVVSLQHFHKSERPPSPQVPVSKGEDAVYKPLQEGAAVMQRYSRLC